MLGWEIAKNIGIYLDARDNLRNANREFSRIQNEEYPNPDPEPKLEVIRVQFILQLKRMYDIRWFQQLLGQ